MRPPAALEQWWGSVEEAGWFGGHFEGATLYPMPGDPEFDQNDGFLEIPLFPGRPDGDVVRVKHDTWEMPLTWCREFETRPLNYLRQKFILPAHGNNELREELLINVKRCVYLELFQSRKPISFSTLRGRRRTYHSFAKYALKTGKRFCDLSYQDIANVVCGLSKSLRKSMPAVYETLRSWRAKAPVAYSLFDPPPSLDALAFDGEHDGLDVYNLRNDDPSDQPDRKWQPFPDQYVAAAGEFCLKVLEELRPAVNGVLRELRAFRPEPTQEQIVAVTEATHWPNGFSATSRAELIGLANLCQTAAIFVLSLMLGPRWEEIAALPCRRAVIGKRQGSVRMNFLNGATFKLSRSWRGESRDWPISDLLANIIGNQQIYISITEGTKFKFLWRSHKTLFNSGNPKRVIDNSLKSFSRDYGFDYLLNGENCHHHRFRKTTARLIVIALHGGPMILRRLFGHEHLSMTLRYILANESLLMEIRNIAEKGQKSIAKNYIDRRDELRGGGADRFREVTSRMIKTLDVCTPEGKRDQSEVTANEILAQLAEGPEGLSIKQILPGLVACFKPIGEAGACSTENELPNLSKCSSRCIWHLRMPEFKEQAKANIADALTHAGSSKPGELVWEHYARVVRHKVQEFPEFRNEFDENLTFLSIVGADNG